MMLSNDECIPRLIDAQVEESLKYYGAVEIRGTKWCGKTWTSRKYSNSYASLTSGNTLDVAQTDLSFLLQGETPRTIDEWQAVPKIWDAIRSEVDKRGGLPGQFILTGSCNVDRSQVYHSGAGRITRVHMYPMTLCELGVSTQQVSLAACFRKERPYGEHILHLDEIAHLIEVGGWPAAAKIKHAERANFARHYVDSLIDESNASGSLTKEDVSQLLQSLARNMGSAVAITTLAKDMLSGVETDSVTRTVRNLVQTGIHELTQLYVLEEMKGWEAPIKSPNRLRSKPKFDFVDPSIPAAIFGLNLEGLLSNMQVLGQLFEQMCLRDLRVYFQANPDAKLAGMHYYRDVDGLEVDVILELQNGAWGAIEIKLSSAKVDQAAKNLLRLKNKIASNPAARNPDPSFLMVLVGVGQFAYQRDDGVCVVPLSTLCP